MILLRAADTGNYYVEIDDGGPRAWLLDESGLLARRKLQESTEDLLRRVSHKGTYAFSFALSTTDVKLVQEADGD